MAKVGENALRRELGLGSSTDMKYTDASDLGTTNAYLIVELDLGC